MKRENLLIGMVLFLVLLNGVILFRFFSKRGSGGGPPPHDRIIVRTLNFDEKQRDTFDALKFKHRTEINELNHEFEATLELYFLSIPEDNTAKKDSLENIIGDLERKKADVTFQHFKDLRALCRDDQEKAFDEFIPRLFRFIVPPGPAGGPGGPPR